jgi:hypothetical protein
MGLVFFQQLGGKQFVRLVDSRVETSESFVSIRYEPKRPTLGVFELFEIVKVQAM